jgi:hypothetical protein
VSAALNRFTGIDENGVELNLFISDEQCQRLVKQGLELMPLEDLEAIVNLRRIHAELERMVDGI